MSENVFIDFNVSVNSQDLTQYSIGTDLQQAWEMLDNTVSGNTARSMTSGLETATLSLSFIWDEALDAILNGLGGAAPFPIVLKPRSGSASSSNPSRTGQFVLESYNPLAGNIGELQKCTAVFRLGNGSGLSRGTGA